MNSSPPPGNNDPNDTNGFLRHCDDDLCQFERMQALDPNCSPLDQIRWQVEELDALIGLLLRKIESGVDRDLEQLKLLLQKTVSLRKEMFMDPGEAAGPDLRPPRLSTILEFVLIALPMQRRNDTVMDIEEWYAEWIDDHGRFSAYCLCAIKVGAALGGSLLDVLERVATIVGKFRGAK